MASKETGKAKQGLVQTAAAAEEDDEEEEEVQDDVSVESITISQFSKRLFAFPRPTWRLRLRLPLRGQPAGRDFSSTTKKVSPNIAVVSFPLCV